MDHELMTMWLSVDPLSDKYPSISPYAYCAWNPVRSVDPDGRDWYESEDGKRLAYFHGEITLCKGYFLLLGVAILSYQVAGIAGEHKVLYLALCALGQCYHFRDLTKMIINIDTTYFQFSKEKKAEPPVENFSPNIFFGKATC